MRVKEKQSSLVGYALSKLSYYESMTTCGSASECHSFASSSKRFYATHLSFTERLVLAKSTPVCFVATHAGQALFKNVVERILRCHRRATSYCYLSGAPASHPRRTMHSRYY